MRSSVNGACRSGDRRPRRPVETVVFGCHRRTVPPSADDADLDEVCGCSLSLKRAVLCVERVDQTRERTRSVSRPSPEISRGAFAPEGGGA